MRQIRQKDEITKVCAQLGNAGRSLANAASERWKFAKNQTWSRIRRRKGGKSGHRTNQSVHLHAAAHTQDALALACCALHIVAKRFEFSCWTLWQARHQCARSIWKIVLPNIMAPLRQKRHPTGRSRRLRTNDVKEHLS